MLVYASNRELYLVARNVMYVDTGHGQHKLVMMIITEHFIEDKREIELPLKIH